MKKFFALLALVLCLSFTFVQSPASADGTIFSRDGYVGYVDGDTVFSRDGYVGYVDGDVDNAAKGAAELLLLK